MITENDVLLILHNDSWFEPSKSDKKKIIVDSDGNQISVAESYYHSHSNGSQIIIRVSNHGTSLNTWVKRRNDPSKSLQNLSVVFSNDPISSNVITEPFRTLDGNGNIVEREVYFVVEQYVYRMDKLSKKDFKKFISKLKSLNDNTVFQDPLKKKASKKAARKVLVPQTSDGNEVPPTNNAIHPRQSIVVKNKEHEIDADGNVIKDNKASLINNIIAETIDDYLSKNLLYEKENKLLTDEEIMDKLSKLVSDLHVKGKLTQKESDKILFYGLYNNKHFQNGGRRSL
ncbi:MAG: hypothetical protein IKT00_04815 [Prevotella sp.]|nr:hypothetical protein [Prevotella sp.]